MRLFDARCRRDDAAACDDDAAMQHDASQDVYCAIPLIMPDAHATAPPPLFTFFYALSPPLRHFKLFTIFSLRHAVPRMSHDAIVGGGGMFTLILPRAGDIANAFLLPPS